MNVWKELKLGDIELASKAIESFGKVSEGLETAAEELTAQANEMQRMVSELVVMVRGANGLHGNGPSATPSLERRARKALPQAKTAVARPAARTFFHFTAAMA